MRAYSTPNALAFSEGAERSNLANDTLSKAPSLSVLRKKRYGETLPIIIPGLNVSEMTTEMLELFISFKINTPLFRKWKIIAAHELATRYIEGEDAKDADGKEKKHKAPRDPVKAYMYAEMEINAYSIEELEANFFQIKIDNKNVNIVKHWCKSQSFEKHNITAIDHCIESAKWNGLLREEIIRNQNAILVAWEKKLIASRFEAHYNKLKEQEKTIDNIIAAKFCGRLTHHFKEHELPDAKISTVLKKVSPRFNQIRLLLARIVKLISVTVQSLPAPIKILFSILSLYFLITFLIDVFIIIKDGPDAFWEDNRPSRMANDGFWFAANFTCFMLTLFLLPVAPVLAPIIIGAITVAGFLFDVGAEIAIGIYGHKKLRKALSTVDAELARLQHIDINHKFTHFELNDYPQGVELKKQQIAQKKTLLEMREQIIKERAGLDVNRAYTVAIMSILAITAIVLAIATTIFFPAAFAFLPAVIVPYVPAIAAGVALVAGSVFGGIGKYIFWNFIMDKQFHADVKEKFDNILTAIKGLFVSENENKQPHKGAQDDWSITTKQIHKKTEMLCSKNNLSGSDKVIIPTFNQNKNIESPKSTTTDGLYRSRSGSLRTFYPNNTSVLKIPALNTSGATSEQPNVRHH